MAGSRETDGADERVGVPTVGTTGRKPRWLSPSRLAVGAIALAALGGGAWWRHRRRARIALQPMSDGWLREREYDAGQHPSGE